MDPANCSANAARQKLQSPKGLTWLLDIRWVVSLNMMPLLL